MISDLKFLCAGVYFNFESREWQRFCLLLPLGVSLLASHAGHKRATSFLFVLVEILRLFFLILLKVSSINVEDLFVWNTKNLICEILKILYCQIKKILY